MAAIPGFLSTHQTKKAVGNSQMILRSPGGGVEAFGPFEGVAPEEDVESAFFLLEKGADVFLEVGGNEVREMSTKVYAADLGSERKGG